MQQWKVFFVKPRTEKKVADFCALYGIKHYLPLREQKRVAQRRKIVVSVPVFPGYVFAKIDDTQRLQMLKTNLLVRVLEPLKPRRMLRDLIMVRRALRADPSLKPVQPLEKGRLVRIVNGPFMGVEGLVARMAGTMRVVLNVDMIGHAVSVTASMDQVTPV
ncbi:MAG: transcription termination/antitermination NusG family protein [Kiritimatiellae bacterium]|nr:transcription termination/antitermination NusG family protein [Kiritimatiellia bacterium]